MGAQIAAELDDEGLILDAAKRYITEALLVRGYVPFGPFA